MNQKRLRLFSILVLSFFMLTSCTQDNGKNPSLGKGDFSLSLKTDNEVIPILRSSASQSTVEPSAEDFAIKLANEDGTFSKTWSSLTNIPTDGSYDVGTYTLSASYGALENEGFDTPYYYGESQFVIRDQETTAVDVMCTLGHVKVTLNYTDAFKGYFNNWETTLRTVGGKEVVANRYETRDIYLRPGDITIKMSLSKNYGSTVEYEPAKIKDAKAREHYVITFDVSDNVGTATLSIVFDKNTVNEPITINVSDEALFAPAPYITLEGITADGTLQWQECENMTQTLSASIVARGGLAGCTLKTESEYLKSIGFPAEIELFELSTDYKTLFENLKIDVKGFGDDASIMSYLGFTQLIGALQIVGDNDTHKFTITARDNNSKVSEPISFTIQSTPLQLSISPVENVMLGATSINLPIVSNAQDMEQLILQRVVNGVASNIPYTIVSSEGNNHQLQATVDVENNAQTLQLVYNNRRTSATQTIGIDVPEYTLKANDYDVWATHATINVVADDATYQDVIDKYLMLYINEGGTWKVVSAQKEGNLFHLSNLQPGAQYSFRSACLTDKSDLEQHELLQITTETAIGLPNNQFDSWTEWFSKELNKGGVYAVAFGTKQETATVTSSNPNEWATVNSKTLPVDAKRQNTWYMVPSTLPVIGVSGNGVLLRNVAWDNDGEELDSESWGNIAFKNSLEKLDAPGFKFRSAGKLFLGAYSYDHSTNTEVYNDGISFTSRPTKLTGYYKYTAVGNDTHGVATITVEHRESNGNTIVLATQTVNLTPTSSYTPFEAILEYTNKAYKATHIKVMMASSNHASYNQADETANIKTTDFKSEAVSLGSELYIDNLSLTY